MLNYWSNPTNSLFHLSLSSPTYESLDSVDEIEKILNLLVPLSLSLSLCPSLSSSVSLFVPPSLCLPLCSSLSSVQTLENWGFFQYQRSVCFFYSFCLLVSGIFLDSWVLFVGNVIFCLNLIMGFFWFPCSCFVTLLFQKLKFYDWHRSIIVNLWLIRISSPNRWKVEKLIWEFLWQGQGEGNKCSWWSGS